MQELQEEEELWKQIHKRDYEASNLGRIRNRNSKRVLATPSVGRGPPRVKMQVNGETENCDLATLIANVWMSRPDGDYIVFHKDGDRQNNRISNLEWIPKNQYDKRKSELAKLSSPKEETKDPNERWGFVPETRYEVSTRGRVRHSHTFNAIKHGNIQGYPTAMIKRNGKFKPHLVHRLVAEVFLPNPNNLTIVHHKNEDRKDCRVENLEWVTAAQNSKHSSHKSSRKVIVKDLVGNICFIMESVRKAAARFGLSDNSLRDKMKGRRKDPSVNGYIFSFAEPTRSPRSYDVTIPSTSMWKQSTSFQKYEVSDTGFVRNISTKAPIALIKAEGYLRVHLFVTKKKAKYAFVHRLVAEMFLDPPLSFQTQINHKNGNRKDNAATNLEWCTPSENAHHAYQVLNKKRTRGLAIDQVDEEGNLVKRFKNMNVASIETGINHKSIARCAQGHSKTAGGYKWVPTEDNCLDESMSAFTPLPEFD